MSNLLIAVFRLLFRPLRKSFLFLKSYTLEAFLLATGLVFVFVQPLTTASKLSVVLGAVLVVVLLNKNIVTHGIRKGIRDVQKEYLYSYIILIIVVLFFIWKVNTEAIIFLTLFITFAIYDWESRVLATGALVSLASCPVLLILKQDTFAEQMAVYAYYFLVMTVVLQIIEFKRHPESFKEEEHPEEK